MSYTNLQNIDLSLAVWLVGSDYDFVAQANTISATGLLKSTKQILLTRRLNQMVKEGRLTPHPTDLADLIAARLGDAIHGAIEQAWKANYREAMAALGTPKHVIDRVRINPTPEEVRQSNDLLPVYIEQRGERQIGGFTISGKLDQSIIGRLKDVKSTSAWSFVYGSKDEAYQLQGSIYRWIHPDKITENDFDIQFIFTDWDKQKARQNADYPQSRLKSYTLPLLSEKDTGAWIGAKVRELQVYKDAPEVSMPRCTDKDLWRSDPVWKYYKDPAKTDRATKNFTDKVEAHRFMSEQNGKGLLKHFPGQVKACNYCSAFEICQQRDEYDLG